MPSFTLRPAEWEDLPALEHIARTTLHESISEQLSPKNLLEGKKIGFEHITVAEKDNEVVGFCCHYACRDADTPYCAEIFSLCVLPEAQNSGIGHALLEDALAVLYISGFKTCKIWLPAENRRARTFFEAAGFTRDNTARVVQFNKTPVLFYRYEHPLTRPDKKYYR